MFKKNLVVGKLSVLSKGANLTQKLKNKFGRQYYWKTNMYISCERETPLKGRKDHTICRR